MYFLCKIKGNVDLFKTNIPPSSFVGLLLKQRIGSKFFSLTVALISERIQILRESYSCLNVGSLWKIVANLRCPLTITRCVLKYHHVWSDWRPGGRRFNPSRGRQHSFVEIDHEIFSTVILSLPLIQEGQLSVSGERMCTILVNHLED